MIGKHTNGMILEEKIIFIATINYLFHKKTINYASFQHVLKCCSVVSYYHITINYIFHKKTINYVSFQHVLKCCTIVSYYHISYTQVIS